MARFARIPYFEAATLTGKAGASMFGDFVSCVLMFVEINKFRGHKASQAIPDKYLICGL